MKKALITNKATTHFFITPFKLISYTLQAPPLAGFRLQAHFLADILVVALMHIKGRPSADENERIRLH